MKGKKILILVFAIILLSLGIYFLKKKKANSAESNFDYGSIDTSTPNYNASGSNTSVSSNNSTSRATQINNAVGDIGKGYQIYQLERKTGVSFNTSILNYLKGLTLQQLKELNKMSIDELRRYQSNIF